MRGKIFLLAALLAAVCAAGDKYPRLAAQPADDPASVESSEKAEKAYAEKCKAEGMVEHGGIYVSKSWFDEFGKMDYGSLLARERRKKDDYLRENLDQKQRLLKTLKENYNIVSLNRKFAPNDPERAIDVLIVGDGFTEKELRRFTDFAESLPKGLLKTSPFDRFTSLFNFHVFSVVSEESGVTTAAKKRKTVFGASVDEGSVLTTGDIGKAAEYAAIISPQAELVIVVANNSDVVRETGTIGASPGVITVNLRTSFGRTVRHELGHAFGWLGDEYVEFQGPKEKPSDEPPFVNVTIESNPAKCKWNYWCKAAPARVGLFEGANYYSKFYYRPEKQCLMRADVDNFCRVCNEAMLIKCFRAVDPVKEISPVSARVVLGRHETQNFALAPSDLGGGTPSGVWLVDGDAAARGRGFTLNASRLAPGRHVVALSFSYNSPDVLRGEEYLERTFFWDVEVLPCAKPQLGFPDVVQKIEVGKLLEFAILNSTPPAAEGEKVDVSVKCLNLPEGAVLDAAAMKFRWRPRSCQRGAHVLHFETTAAGEKILSTVRVDVIDPSQKAGSRPLVMFIPERLVNEGEMLSFTVKAVDLDADNVAIVAQNLPAGASFNPSTNEFRWLPGFFQASDDPYEITFYATDGQGRGDSETAKIFVRDSRGGKSAFDSVMKLVKAGDKGRMRDVEYGLVSYSSALRSLALLALKDYYGAAIVVDCLRLMKSRNAPLSNIAAATAIEAIKLADEQDVALMKFCLDKIKSDFWETSDRCAKLQSLLEAMRDNEKLKPLKSDVEDLLKKKPG